MPPVREPTRTRTRPYANPYARHARAARCNVVAAGGRGSSQVHGPAALRPRPRPDQSAGAPTRPRFLRVTVGFGAGRLDSDGKVAALGSNRRRNEPTRLDPDRVPSIPRSTGHAGDMKAGRSAGAGEHPAHADMRRVSHGRFNHTVDEKAQARAAASAAVRARKSLAEDIDRLRRDAGWSVAGLARGSGVDATYLRRILDPPEQAPLERPSLETYARLAAALGADLSAKVYPNTGPTVRDRHQARMLELLLAAVHPRWHAYTEVAVRRPSRGWVDAALFAERENVLVATEIQSELRRFEQLIRWHAAKVESLPSWEDFGHLGDAPRITQLLVVRRTRTTRGVVAQFARQMRTAYPAHPDDALAALTGTAPWPGAAMVWVALDGGRARFVAGR